MNKLPRNQHLLKKGEKYAGLFPTPYIGCVGSGTICGVPFDEALAVINKNEKLLTNPEDAE